MLNGPSSPSVLLHLRDTAHDIWQFTDLSLKAGVKQEVAYSPVVIAGEATNQLSSSQFLLLE